MHHPLESLNSNMLDRMIWPLVLISLLMLFILNLVGLPLITPASPYGIVSFELARNEVQASAILASWDQAAHLRAAFSLGLDFLFIPLYTAALTLACLWAARFRRRRRRLPSWLVLIGIPGIPLAWAQLGAGLLDTVENIALVRMLFGMVSSPWPQIASICAFTKFILIVSGILYSLTALAAYTVAAFFNRRSVGI
jgi:hypothetical protein